MAFEEDSEPEKRSAFAVRRSPFTVWRSAAAFFSSTRILDPISTLTGSCLDSATCVRHNVRHEDRKRT